MTEHCDEAIFEALAMGRLAPEEAKPAMRHIGECEECGRKFASAKDYIESMRKALRGIDKEKED